MTRQELVFRIFAWTLRTDNELHVGLPPYPLRNGRSLTAKSSGCSWRPTQHQPPVPAPVTRWLRRNRQGGLRFPPSVGPRRWLGFPSCSWHCPIYWCPFFGYRAVCDPPHPADDSLYYKGSWETRSKARMDSQRGRTAYVRSTMGKARGIVSSIRRRVGRWASADSLSLLGSFTAILVE